MDRSRYRWILRLAIVLVVGLIALLWAVGQQTRTLTIENQAQQTIASLQIILGGETRRFENVAAGREVRAEGKGQGEESYTVVGELANGTRIRSSGRIKESVQFLLLPDGQLQPKPQRKGPF